MLNIFLKNQIQLSFRFDYEQTSPLVTNKFYSHMQTSKTKITGTEEEEDDSISE